METRKLLLAAAAAATLAGAVLPVYAADDEAAASGQSATATQYLDDSALTAKVKTSLLADKSVAGSEIKVETANGIVHLAGVTKSEEEKKRAAELAASVDGVKEVKNEITVQ